MCSISLLQRFWGILSDYVFIKTSTCFCLGPQHCDTIIFSHDGPSRREALSWKRCRTCQWTLDKYKYEAKGEDFLNYTMS